MTDVIYLNYAAVVLLLIILGYIIRKRMIHGRSNRLFVLLFASCCVCTFADIVRIDLCRYVDGLYTLKVVSHFVCFLSEVMLPLLYTLYLMAVTDGWHLLTRRRIKFVLTLLLTVASVLLLVFNLFVPILYDVNPDGTIVIKKLFYILYSAAIVYMLILFNYFWTMRKFALHMNIGVIITPLIISFAILTVQVIFPQQRMMMFGMAMCFVMMILINRREEDYLNEDTQLMSYTAYENALNFGVRSGKKFCIIMINVLRYDSMFRVVSFDDLSALIKKMADTVKAELTEKRLDSTVYYGGEGRFRVMISNRSLEKCREIAERLNKKMNNDFHIDKLQLDVNCNICVVSVPDEISEADSLLMLGNDISHYKHTGKLLSAGELLEDKDFRIHMNMNRIIDNALADHRLAVYYQPIYSVKTGKFVSAEALVRLNDPVYGFVSPALFIPAAESSGAIHKIGSYVMEEVCKFISSPEFVKLGLEYIEVNLSVEQCLRSNLVDSINAQVEKYSISPTLLNLEITETSDYYSQNRMIDNINILHNEGFEFSLDDFGTGYSNMLRIASLPLHIIKLDRTFVLMEENQTLRQSRTLLENMIRMLKDMHKEIVVEGIETIEMVERFSELGCDYIQGFYFSRPLPRSEFIQFIKEHNCSL